MKMNDTKLIRLAGIVVVGCAIACGCRPKKQPTKQPPPPPPPPYGNVDQRMSELQQRGTELSHVAQQLPGRTTDEDRRLVLAAFDRAAASLELLAGPNPPGSYRQAQRIVDSTRLQLSSGVTADAKIVSGLRAIQNALIDVRQRAYPDDAQVQKLVDDLRARIYDLDRVRGPMHSVVVGHAFTATSNVINQMAGEFKEPAAPPAQPQQAAAPVPPAPVAPAAAPQPQVVDVPAPAAPQPAAPAAALPPAPPANGQPTPEQVEQMRRELEQLRQENARLKQQQGANK
jgi:hypothetical protein